VFSKFVAVKPLLLLNNIGNVIPSNNFLIDVCLLVLTISARNWFLSGGGNSHVNIKYKEKWRKREIVLSWYSSVHAIVHEFPRSSLFHEREPGECYTQVDCIRAVSAFRPAGILHLD